MVKLPTLFRYYPHPAPCRSGNRQVANDQQICCGVRPSRHRIGYADVTGEQADIAPGAERPGDPARIAVLVGGVGGARFLQGVRELLPEADISAIVNVGDDVWMHGLRICPDLDTCMYTLGGGIDTERG